MTLAYIITLIDQIQIHGIPFPQWQYIIAQNTEEYILEILAENGIVLIHYKSIEIPEDLIGEIEDYLNQRGIIRSNIEIRNNPEEKWNLFLFTT